MGTGAGEERSAKEANSTFDATDGKEPGCSWFRKARSSELKERALDVIVRR